MLIYTSRSPGWGKQKPKQWGPLSAVRSAVFANADRMGIDPSAIQTLCPLWEGAGVAHDITGNNNDGSLLSGANWENKGIDFPNNNSICVVGRHRPFVDSFTIRAFANLRTVASANVLVSKRDSWGAETNFMFFNPNPGTGREISFWSGTEASGRVYFGTQMLLGEHSYTVALPTDGVQPLLYIDNNSPLTGDINLTLASTGFNANINIGNADPAGFEYFDGTIHYVEIYSQALSATQIAQLHETPYALLQPVPQTYYFDMAPLAPATSVSVSGLDTGTYHWRVRARIS